MRTFLVFVFAPIVYFLVIILWFIIIACNFISELIVRSKKKILPYKVLL